ncbi:SDR family oxidoreductase [Amycolatopsis sp. CA-230715]|uniref:SDR family oxidoreductase n=1 Tax=Amycolatopsis sp. CA-230715 TaxID=2745196 RepID=UPI0020B2D88D|nr:NAD(P)H-binding protein [Amycolatopsis sp. CA-230715]
MILVTGATGNVGQNVVAQLRSAGEDVRVLTRSPGSVNFPGGVEVIGGALDDARAVSRALDGVEKAYLFPVPDAAAGFASAAKAAGLRRIVVLSSSATTLPGNPIGAYHLTVERAVESGSTGSGPTCAPARSPTTRSGSGARQSGASPSSAPPTAMRGSRRCTKPISRPSR